MIINTLFRHKVTMPYNVFPFAYKGIILNTKCSVSLNYVELFNLRNHKSGR